VSTDQNHGSDNREGNAALVAGVLAAVLVILLTAMALLAFPGAGAGTSAFSAALG